MASHHVEGLEWAEWSANPFGASPKPRAARFRAGLAFQRKVALALSEFPLREGPWIRFKDSSGIHFAQPDFVLWPSSLAPVVVEAKLTFCQEAFAQLHNLYVPLLSLLLSKEVCSAVVCKNLGGFAGRASSLSDLRCREDVAESSVFFWSANHSRKMNGALFSFLGAPQALRG